MFPRPNIGMAQAALLLLADAGALATGGVRERLLRKTEDVSHLGNGPRMPAKKVVSNGKRKKMAAKLRKA